MDRSTQTSAINNWLRDRGRDGTVRPNALTAAILSHGDIPWGGTWPYVSFGLAEGIGKPCGNAWHRLLQGGELLAPLPAPNAAPDVPPQRVTLRPSDEPYLPGRVDQVVTW